MRQKLQFTVILLVIVMGLGVWSFFEYRNKQELIFAESLDETAVTIDGYALTLKDIAFYIAYEEQKIEETARIYNPENTSEYWNIYTNHTFLREEGKQTVLEMAIHDEIFYQLAIENGMNLTVEEEKHLANDWYDFWGDLEEEQRVALGVTEKNIAESMRKIALAEKYQHLLAEMEQKEFEVYSVYGQTYEKLREEHDCVVNEEIWARVPFGSITVNH